jgi:surface protein
MLTHIHTDVSEVTNVRGAFSTWLNGSGHQNMYNFNADLSKWNTGKVTNMFGMFRCDEGTSLDHSTSYEAGDCVFNSDLTNWNTSKVTSMEVMFYMCDEFNGNISSFDTSRVIRMNGMFDHAKQFNSDISNFDTSAVLTMERMFEWATAFNQNISNFDTRNVKSMAHMFTNFINYDTESSFEGHGLENFDTSSVTDMNSMFYSVTYSLSGSLSLSLSLSLAHTHTQHSYFSRFARLTHTLNSLDRPQNSWEMLVHGVSRRW